MQDLYQKIQLFIWNLNINRHLTFLLAKSGNCGVAGAWEDPFFSPRRKPNLQLGKGKEHVFSGCQEGQSNVPSKFILPLKNWNSGVWKVENGTDGPIYIPLENQLTSVDGFRHWLCWHPSHMLGEEEGRGCGESGWQSRLGGRTAGMSACLISSIKS